MRGGAFSSDELEDLRDAASEVDLSGLLSAEGDAETIGQKLAEFKQKVYAEFDGKCPDAKTKFSATKLAIMKNLFMHYAIMRTDIKVASFNGIAKGLRILRVGHRSGSGWLFQEPFGQDSAPSCGCGLSA